ncbi:MAG: hypothetical protein U5L96_15270 [Owenweeksia sp.]|nr:hypothetical protein [Owenweeksia sp.]
MLVTLARSSIEFQVAPHINSSQSSSFSISLPGAGELMQRSLLKPLAEKAPITYVIALFTPSSDTGLFPMDGQPLPTGTWQAFAARPGWSWAQVEVNKNTHLMESSGAGFTGYHYSYAKLNPTYNYLPSYGYCLIESRKLPEDSLYFQIQYPGQPPQGF